MDERMFLFDIDDHQIMVGALEAHIVVWSQEFLDLRRNVADLQRSPVGTDAGEYYLRAIELRVKTLSEQVAYVLSECMKRKRRLANRRYGLTDVELHEETS